MGTAFKKQSPCRVYCILCVFSEDRDILSSHVLLIGRWDFYSVDMSPQLIAPRFNDPLGEALSVAVAHDRML